MSIIPGRVPNSMPANTFLRQLLRCRRSRCIGASYPSRDIGWRRYGTRTKAAVDGPSFACTWLTKTPGEISPDDIFSSLPPIPSSTLSEGNIPILLVTPQFAPWVDNANSFLGQWMNRLYPTFDFPSTLYAIAAVVDKLPDTRIQPTDAAENTNSMDALESEGLSVLFVRPENVRGKAAPPRRIRGPEAEEPALVFSVQAGTPHISVDTAHRPTHEVGLRLANTVFVNGNENTMFGMSWIRDPASGTLALNHYVNLSICVIGSSAKTIHNSFDLPLHPVSQRRRVVSSMGNILRQITNSTDDSSSDAMPASSELEKELPRYISEHNIADPLVSVWALVEKADMKPSMGEGVQDHITNALRAGGKLYRVMSGGGGWGKKQGLLSLDPDLSLAEAATKENLTVLNNLFGPNADSVQDMPPAFDKLLMDDLSLLSQTASEGDYVQFFASVEPNYSQSASAKSVDPQQPGLLYRFGVVSDAEDYEGESTAGTPQKDLAVVPSYFGALSTKTITYLQPIIDADSKGKEPESCTKLDVPGSRVGLVLE